MMSTYAFRLTAGALSLLSTLPALSLAQSDAARTAGTVSALAPVVVTASRTPQPLDTVLGDVTVIDHETLQNSKSSSLAEILSRQPGVQIYTSGGPQTVTGVYLRGANPLQTLVLIDGMRINDSNAGSIAWNALDPAIIERVEILRGAASSLYGADAIGGVINIITRRAADGESFNAWANFGLGSRDTFKTSMGATGAQNGWDYRLSASKASSDGFDAKTVGSSNHHPDRDGYEQHSVAGALGYNWRENQRIGLDIYNGYIDGDYDGGGHPSRSLTRQQAYSLSSTNQLTDIWQSVVRFGFAKDSIESRSGNTSSLVGMIQRQYSWQNNFQLASSQHLGLVLERLEERPLTASEYAESRRNTNSAAAIYRGDFGRHHLQASIRHDNVSGLDSQTTGSLAYDLDLDSNWRAGLAASTGFRMPTFADMYTPYAWGYRGNPDLKPEKSRNIEAHVRYASGPLSVEATVYQNKVRDLIQGYVCDASFECTAENIDRATIRGATLTGAYAWDNTTLRASADFLRPRNDTTGATLARRAKQVYNLGVDHRIGKLLLGADYQFQTYRYDDAANNTRLGGYGLLNLRAAYDFTRQVGVQFYWNNVLDKDYTQAYGYRNDGSNVFVNLSWKY
ncbi:TonB-dependent receptor plug domain-containing protein [Corticimicrobacter populi]|nr:TonB-dependent receptor [Corticimicrobacter populi]